MVLLQTTFKRREPRSPGFKLCCRCPEAGGSALGRDPWTGSMRPPLPRDPAAGHSLLTRAGQCEVRGLGDTLRDTPCASPPFSGSPSPSRPQSPCPGRVLHLAPTELAGAAPMVAPLWADHRATDSGEGVGVGTGRAVSSVGDCSKTAFPRRLSSPGGKTSEMDISGEGGSYCGLWPQTQGHAAVFPGRTPSSLLAHSTSCSTQLPWSTPLPGSLRCEAVEAVATCRPRAPSPVPRPGCWSSRTAWGTAGFQFPGMDAPWGTAPSACMFTSEWALG